MFFSREWVQMKKHLLNSCAVELMNKLKQLPLLLKDVSLIYKRVVIKSPVSWTTSDLNYNLRVIMNRIQVICNSSSLLHIEAKEEKSVKKL